MIIIKSALACLLVLVLITAASRGVLMPKSHIVVVR